MIVPLAAACEILSRSAVGHRVGDVAFGTGDGAATVDTDTTGVAPELVAARGCGEFVEQLATTAMPAIAASIRRTP